MTATTKRIIDRLRRAHAKLKTYHALSAFAGDEFSDTLNVREQSGVDYYRSLDIEIVNADRDHDEMRAKAEFLRLLWNHWPDILSALRQMERRAAGDPDNACPICGRCDCMGNECESAAGEGEE